ncbi:MAG TPA: hypothetical protein VFA43_11855 [Gemmatimonadaceae bacterium]|nr:hypothetical protein [Gemmatimonadaceae bacterium]
MSSVFLKGGRLPNGLKLCDSTDTKTATVVDDRIHYDGGFYGSLTAAARAASGYTGIHKISGWDYWFAEDGDGKRVQLQELRRRQLRGG